MRKNPATNLKNVDYLQLKEGQTFQRKGIVGGWKKYFTEEQNLYLEKRIDEKLAGTSLRFEYK